MARPGRSSAAAAGAGLTAGRVLVLLFLANLLNYFDRVMPAIVIEEVRIEFGLSDTQIGLVASALTVVYALAGLPLARLADRCSRKHVIAGGLAVWSLMTAATGAAANFLSLLLVRVGVGIGEASYAPAATSLIADLYPPERRSRALAVFMLGLPVGLVLAYFTVGSIAEALDSWRAPFVLAGIPGLVLAVVLLRIREPERGAADGRPVAEEAPDDPLRRLARIPTIWWLSVAFLAYNVGAFTVNAFTVPLLQRSFGLSLTGAATITGVVVGVTGLVGLTAGGRVADAARRRSARHRVLVGAASLSLAAPLALLALSAGEASVATFAAVFGLAWLLGYVFYPCCYAAVSDVVEPRLRATAVAVLFAFGYLLGGAAGPLVVGALSDGFAMQAMAEAGARTLTTEFRGIGLHRAMLAVVPVSLLAAAAAMSVASRTIARDHARMPAGGARAAVVGARRERQEA